MTYKIPDGILMQAVADEMVLLNPDSGVYFTLDAIGTRMVELMRELGDAVAVADAISKEYEVEPGTALADLEALLGEMAAKGLAE